MPTDDKKQQSNHHETQNSLPRPWDRKPLFHEEDNSDVLLSSGYTLDGSFSAIPRNKFSFNIKTY